MNASQTTQNHDSRHHQHANGQWQAFSHYTRTQNTLTYTLNSSIASWPVSTVPVAPICTMSSIHLQLPLAGHAKPPKFTYQCHYWLASSHHLMTGQNYYGIMYNHIHTLTSSNKHYSAQPKSILLAMQQYNQQDTIPVHGSFRWTKIYVTFTTVGTIL